MTTNLPALSDETVQPPPAPAPAESALNAWAPALELPCKISFGLPIPRFTLGDLLNLRVGTVIDTARPEGTDVVVMLNDHIIGWAEFEASGQQIAFRFTELAG
jgi:flagellar motor switch/type III secretory pathway protein FliN